VKLPFKGDPGGEAEGAGLRASVLDTLFEHSVSISPGEAKRLCWPPRGRFTSEG